MGHMGPHISDHERWSGHVGGVIWHGRLRQVQQARAWLGLLGLEVEQQAGPARARGGVAGQAD